MAHLNKLAIRGIRSFDDKQISVIEFFSPVTVIVGHNGSGKTTIIECLKYATTGDQPPNTRGGAFVHDPKMANEKEVKAQVKLRFNAANGKRMLAVRNLSVTVKKTSGLTMKTLESILALADGEDKGGKRGVISTKCAEMDTEIPQLLGVSKSVLENVIFCHQEDSYWPLAEPSILKKKFDDIFEATKYTKALENIKGLRKDRVADLKAEKERLESLSREKSHADKLKTRLTDQEQELAEKEVTHTEIKTEYDALVLSNKAFLERSTMFRQTYGKYQQLEETRKRLQEELDESSKHVEVLKGSDNDLREQLENFEEHIETQKGLRNSAQSKLSQAQRDLTTCRKRHTELVAQRGSLQAQAEAQDQRIQEREDFIREVSQKQSIRLKDSGSPLESSVVRDFTQQLDALKEQRQDTYRQLQDENRKMVRDYNSRMDVMKTAVQSYEVQRKNYQEQIAANQRTMTSLKRTVEDQEDLQVELASLKSRIQETDTIIENLRANIEIANYDGNLKNILANIRSLGEKKDSFGSELVALGSQASDRAKLDLKRQEIKSKGAEMKSLLQTAGPKFLKLVGEEVSKGTMEKDLDRLQRSKEEEKDELEKTSSLASSEFRQIETSLSALKRRLKEKKKEAEDLKKKIHSDLDFPTLNDAIKDAHKQTDDIRKTLGELNGSMEIFVKYLSDGKATHKCPACSQSLAKKEMMATFEENMRTEQKKRSKERIQEEESDLDGWMSETDRLEKLLPDQNNLNRLLKIDIPEIEAEIKEKETRLPELSETAEKTSEDLANLVHELKDIATLKTQASNISRLDREVELATTEVASLEKQLAASGSSKTTDDVQAEIDSLSGQIRTAERERAMLETSRNSQQQTLRTHENELNSLKVEEVHKQHNLEEKKRNEEKLEELKKSNISLAAQTKDAVQHLENSREPIENLKKEHEERISAMEGRMSEVAKVLEGLNQAIDQLRRLTRAIDSYIKAKKPEQLQSVIEELTETDSQTADTEGKVSDLQKTIAQIEKEINSGGSTLANLRDNIRLRKLAANIQETAQEMDGIDIDEAARAKRSFDAQYAPLKEKEDRLQADAAYLLGQLNSLRSQLSVSQKDLKEFKDIYRRYTDQLVKVKMSDMANNDLEKYAKALDNAIMKYHALKMEEVNDTMKHLWNKTYQGTDIDGIKIRSDAEGGASKRSYNYRVVMTKDQVEMDMRGRCSAGQKMLASIIIRLALSDSFGQNCGILALDEPTNALDTENIDALASSLVDIINERKDHSNFQLIIITHDENFLRKLGQSSVMEHYWRVSRDARQKSVIERQRFR